MGMTYKFHTYRTGDFYEKTIGIATLGFFKFGIGSFYYYFISETRKYD